MTGDTTKEPLLGPDASLSPSSSNGTLLGNDEAAMEKAALEPQNALTRKFTEQEWIALRKFRTRLPEVYTAAYGQSTTDATPHPLAFSIWGIQVNLAEPQADPRVSVILMKFLRAKDLDVDAAQKMLADALKWRKDIGIDLIGEEDAKKLVKTTGVSFGHDKDGLPVSYMKAGTIDWKVFQTDRYLAVHRQIRGTEYMFRKILDFESIHQIVKVVDVKDITSNPVPVDIGAELKTMKERYYPGHVAYSVAINMPSVTTVNWLLRFGKWLDSVLDTPAKSTNHITHVGTDKNEIARTLLARIDAKQLPRELGGEAEGFSWTAPGPKK